MPLTANQIKVLRSASVQTVTSKDIRASTGLVKPKRLLDQLAARGWLQVIDGEYMITGSGRAALPETAHVSLTSPANGHLVAKPVIKEITQLKRREPPHNLTDTQQRVYDFVSQRSSRGVATSHIELQAELGWKSECISVLKAAAAKAGADLSSVKKGRSLFWSIAVEKKAKRKEA